MIISIIAAADDNNVIGSDNKLLWKLPADFERMKSLTMGHPIIMGRKTHESIGRALPGRRNIVITRQNDAEYEGCDVVSSLEEAIDLAKTEEQEESFIFGGEQIYKLALPLADRIYLTRVHAKLEGDAHFPEISTDDWEEISREEHEADAEHAHAYTFLTYEKKA